MIKKKRSVATKLRELKHAVPFVPFQVKTATGDQFTLITADDFIVSPAGDTAFFNPRGEDTTRLVYLEQVKSVDLIASRRRDMRRANGRRRK